MAEAGDTPQDRAYRVGFKRTKREDYAIDMLRSVRANLHDIELVNRTLREVGRYYNAIADAPIVSLEIRQRIVRLLETGHFAEAKTLLDGCLARYEVPEQSD